MKLDDKDFIQLCDRVAEGFSLRYAFSFLGFAPMMFDEMVVSDPRLAALNAVYVKIPHTSNFGPSTTLSEEVKRLEALVFDLNSRLQEKDRVLTQLRLNPHYLPTLMHVQ